MLRPIEGKLSRPLLLKLGRSGGFGEEETAAVLAAPWVACCYEKGEMLERQGETPASLYVVCDGIAIASKRLENGSSQNVALLIMGDVLNYDSYFTKVSNVSIAAVTSLVALRISHANFSLLFDGRAAVRGAFLRDMATVNMVAHEWLVGQGRRCLQRVAHLLCEIFSRFDRVGLAEDQECPFPLTQAEFADTVGLSLVHMNRTIQLLRRGSLIELRAGRLRILDWTALRATAAFDPAYLGP